VKKITGLIVIPLIIAVVGGVAVVLFERYLDREPAISIQSEGDTLIITNNTDQVLHVRVAYGIVERGSRTYCYPNPTRADGAMKCLFHPNTAIKTSMAIRFGHGTLATTSLCLKRKDDCVRIIWQGQLCHGAVKSLILAGTSISLGSSYPHPNQAKNSILPAGPLIGDRVSPSIANPRDLAALAIRSSTRA
jgi:hypothetical protein